MIKTIRFIIGLLIRYPRGITALLIFGILSAMLELFSIALLVPFIESLKENSSSLNSISGQYPIIGFLAPYFQEIELITKIRMIAVALFIIEAAKGCASFISNRYSSKLQFNVNADLQMEVMDNVLSAGMGFIHSYKTANLFTILNNYTLNTGRAILALTGLIPDIFQIMISVFILFTISTSMTLITMLVGILITLMLSRTTQLAQEYGRKNIAEQINVNHRGIEILSGINIIKFFGRVQAIRDRYRQEVRKLCDTRFKQVMISAAVNPLTTILLAFTVMVILIVSTYFLNREAEYWVGVLLIFLVVFARLGGPLARINTSRSQLTANLPSMQALCEFLSIRDKEQLPLGDKPLSRINDTIEFKNVSFRYSSNSESVINNLSFKIPKGKSTAIVGDSGSGKTTLVSLLARLYDPSEGQILVDGTDLKEINPDHWYRKIGVVSQSVFLFNDSIRENLLFAKPDATNEELEQAARQANAYDFIMDMPAAFETLVGDRGIRLSGGQAQRISIARAMLTRPELLILDEATSALDSKSELLVQDAIEKIGQRCTLFIVAHRLATVKKADNIIVLKDGELVEQGTHRQLLAKKGHYYQFATLQDLDNNL